MRDYASQIVMALVASVVVAIAWTAWRSSGAQGKAVPPWAGAVVDWGKPARHGCDTGWMGDALGHPHPLYRQQQPGQARDGLTRWGWAWIADPPGEQDLAA